MYRASTPTHKFGFPFSKDVIAELLITYMKADTDEIVLEKRLSDGKFGEDGKFSYTLTQEETSMFDGGMARVQARVKSQNGKVMASKIYLIDVLDVLNDEVL